MKKICIIVNGYPTKENPKYAFIQPVALSMADEGYFCTVIAPQSFSHCMRAGEKRRPYRWVDKSKEGKEVIIYQPLFFSVSRFKIFGYSISGFFRDRAIKKCIAREKINPDVYYAHFWDCGVAACKAAAKKNIPVFVATGESVIRVFNNYKKDYVKKLLRYVHGVICVSTKNLEESKELGLITDSMSTIVLPNAVNTTDFYSMPQAEARKKLQIDEKSIIAIFVGAFTERKGVHRVIEAAKDIPDLKLIIIGKGEEIEKSDNIIFAGTVPHSEIVTYLNAADMFVLPTLHEGCCNAIVEAKACGLPVISSDRDFNDDILNEQCAIKVDPLSIDELRDAMNTLVNDRKLRETMGTYAYEESQECDIEKRVKKILTWMEREISAED